jgi:hypothetical protein
MKIQVSWLRIGPTSVMAAYIGKYNRKWMKSSAWLPFSVIFNPLCPRGVSSIWVFSRLQLLWSEFSIFGAMKGRIYS